MRPACGTIFTSGLATMRAVRLLLLIAALLLPTSAWACGQTTHVWISLEALQELPDGELRELLTDPANRDALVNGTMFPDGGYAVGDDYGEMAHWEPMQQALLAWVRDEYGPSYSSPEARLHVAFLMGMASHGMSDEVFDSLFYERSRAYDPGHDEEVTSLDTASDVTFAAEVGGIEAPELWAPFEAITSIFNDVLAYEVDEATIRQGQDQLYIALAFVDWARTNEERLETFTAEFPWGAAHMSDPTVPGSPPRQAPIIAGYWAEMWQRLHEDMAFDEPVLAIEPRDGSWEHPQDHSLVEARVQLTFGRGVTASSLGAIRVEGPEGEVPLDVGHFYGDLSHTVLLRPQSDWAPDSEYRVTVDAGLTNFDGVATTEAFASTFHTGVEPAEEAAPSEPPAGCSVADVPHSRWISLPLLLLATRRRTRPGKPTHADSRL